MTIKHIEQIWIASYAAISALVTRNTRGFDTSMRIDTFLASFSTVCIAPVQVRKIQKFYNWKVVQENAQKRNDMKKYVTRSLSSGLTKSGSYSLYLNHQSHSLIDFSRRERGSGVNRFVFRSRNRTRLRTKVKKRDYTLKFPQTKLDIQRGRRIDFFRNTICHYETC